MGRFNACGDLRCRLCGLVVEGKRQAKLLEQSQRRFMDAGPSPHSAASFVIVHYCNEKAALAIFQANDTAYVMLEVFYGALSTRTHGFDYAGSRCGVSQHLWGPPRTGCCGWRTLVAIEVQASVLLDSRRAPVILNINLGRSDTEPLQGWLALRAGRVEANIAAKPIAVCFPLSPPPRQCVMLQSDYQKLLGSYRRAVIINPQHGAETPP